MCPQGTRWRGRAQSFQLLCARTCRLHSRFVSTAGRALLYDLHPYLWDIRNMLLAACAFVLWLGTCLMPALASPGSPHHSFPNPAVWECQDPAALGCTCVRSLEIHWFPSKEVKVAGTHSEIWGSSVQLEVPGSLLGAHFPLTLFLLLPLVLCSPAPLLLQMVTSSATLTPRAPGGTALAVSTGTALAHPPGWGSGCCPPSPPAPQQQPALTIRLPFPTLC